MLDLINIVKTKTDLNADTILKQMNLIENLNGRIVINAGMINDQNDIIKILAQAVQELKEWQEQRLKE